MSDFLRLIRDHQAATSTSDGQMLAVLCGFIESFFDEDTSQVVDYVVEKLERGPGPCEILWRSEPFTEEDQDRMAQMMIEEVRDSTKYYAHQELDNETDILELIGYADTDPEDTCRVLFNWGNAVELEQLKANMGAAGVDIEDHIKYALRMGLIDDRGVTDLGREYMSRWL